MSKVNNKKKWWRNDNDNWRGIDKERKEKTEIKIKIKNLAELVNLPETKLTLVMVWCVRDYYNFPEHMVLGNALHCLWTLTCISANFVLFQFALYSFWEDTVNKWSKKIEIMWQYTWWLTPIVRYFLFYSSFSLVEMEMNMSHEVKDVLNFILSYGLRKFC